MQKTEEVICSLETLILLLTFSEDKYPYQLKIALKCAVRLCEVKTEHCERFVELLGARLGSLDGILLIFIYVNCLFFHVTVFLDDCTNLVCEALGAIASLQPDALLNLLGSILKLLNDLVTVDNPSTQQTQTRVLLCTLIFQTLAGYEWNADVISKCFYKKEFLNTSTILILDAIHYTTRNNNLWANYRIARAAVRYGHHKIGVDIFRNLTENVSSEHLHFWLVCLKEMSEGESILLSQADNKIILVDRLDQGVLHYNRAIAALKASSCLLCYFCFKVLILGS